MADNGEDKVVNEEETSSQNHAEVAPTEPEITEPVPVPVKPKVRMDYYQTDPDMIVSIYLKSLKAEDVNVEFSAESFRVQANLPDSTKYENEVHLLKHINPDTCSYKVLGTKIEIRLRKLEGSQWSALETVKETNDLRPVYPSSSKKKQDWNKVEKDIERQEKDEPDADVNSLFSKIFESGDDNTRKAMMKSMQESGGTVLSTNWEEVGKKKVDISPPDGMEYKKWDV